MRPAEPRFVVTTMPPDDAPAPYNVAAAGPRSTSTVAMSSTEMSSSRDAVAYASSSSFATGIPSTTSRGPPSGASGARGGVGDGRGRPANEQTSTTRERSSAHHHADRREAGLQQLREGERR